MLKKSVGEIIKTIKLQSKNVRLKQADFFMSSNGTLLYGCSGVLFLFLIFFFFSSCDKLPQPTFASEYWEIYKVTAYCDCPKCCGIWAKKGVNKNGQRIFANGEPTAFGGVAADKSIPFGSKVIFEKEPIAGKGRIFIVKDRGGTIRSKRIDLWLETHQDALKFGVKYLRVKIESYKLKEK